ncbi:MAG: hypothetical protein GY859_27885, partial [Desulfobacterales bacterium]|nr:hypothetical protein [Desulfobacterales bacterium]
MKISGNSYKNGASHIYRLFWTSGLAFVLLILAGGAPALMAAKGAGGAPVLENRFLQFTAGDHLLGFGDGEMVIASSDHMAKVEFVGAAGRSPVVEDASAGPGESGPAPLKKVTYPDLWSGITLVYENHGGAVVKSTYYIAPGQGPAPYEKIRLRYNAPVLVAAAGDLVLDFETGRLRESAPVAWQEIAGRKVPVSAAFKILGNREVGFQVESYDPRFPLIIDPVMEWNTFVGSSAVDTTRGVAVDASGNIYVVGYSSLSWGPGATGYAGLEDAFVAKYDVNGFLLWNTFLGGASDDRGEAIALDESGNVYVTGYSKASWGSPTNPHAGLKDVFVAKLNNDGDRQWHTFLGSASDDSAGAIAVIDSNDVYVVGDSDAHWGTNAICVMYSSCAHQGGSDAFVAKLSSADNGELQWSFLMGAAGDDEANGMAVLGDNLYIT